MQAATPLITVITVVYNSALALEKTIQSVLQLSYPNIEYIVIDGGSTDGTVDVIKSYSSQIKYWISEPDKGIYDAMNKGWTVADNYSYIIFLGAGDYIIHLPNMANYKNENIIYGRVEIGKKYVFNTVVDFRLKLANAVHHQALLIKKSIHPAPPFSLQYPVFADFDFNQRLYKKGFHFVKDNTFLSHAMEGGISAARNEKEMIEIVQKNFGNMYVLLAKLYYLFQAVKRTFTGLPILIFL